MSPRGAPFTTGMIFLLWLVFIVDRLAARGADLGPFMLAGAILPDRILHGEWWRLVSYGFLHFTVVHILFNSYALFQAGVLVEYVYGSARYAAIYFIALLGGGIAAYLWTLGSNDVTAGASGAIMGVFGAMAVLALRLPPLRRELAQAAFIPILLTLGYGFLNPGISNAGHIGGLISGALAAAFITPARADDIIRHLRLGQDLW
jgi:rhomboid protease GluP